MTRRISACCELETTVHLSVRPGLTAVTFESCSFGVGRTEPSARYDLTQTSPVTSELRSLVDDLRVKEVNYVLSPMYNVSVGAVDSSTPPRHSVAILATRSQPEGVLSPTRLDTTPSLGSWSLLALALRSPK